MRQTVPYFLLIVLTLILLAVPAVAMAASTGAVKEMEHVNYRPPEEKADDSTMAVIASGIFGVPVAAWFVSRSRRKAKKNSE